MRYFLGDSRAGADLASGVSERSRGPSVRWVELLIPGVGGIGSEMTKSELIDAIAGRGELTKARAELVVNCVFDAMTEALQAGEGIEIRGFGSFTVRPY